MGESQALDGAPRRRIHSTTRGEADVLREVEAAGGPRPDARKMGRVGRAELEKNRAQASIRDPLAARSLLSPN